MDFVTAYFDAERAESQLFIAAGLLAIAAAAAWLLTGRQPTAFYRGLAVPLVAVALIQLTVGVTIYWRSPMDEARVVRALQVDHAHIAKVERPRMQAVMHNFALYRATEVALLLSGLALLAGAARASALRGAGLGMALQSALMLALDHFAQRRGEEYLQLLGAG